MLYNALSVLHRLSSPVKREAFHPLSTTDRSVQSIWAKLLPLTLLSGSATSIVLWHITASSIFVIAHALCTILCWRSFLGKRAPLVPLGLMQPPPEM